MITAASRKRNNVIEVKLAGRSAPYAATAISCPYCQFDIIWKGLAGGLVLQKRYCCFRIGYLFTKATEGVCRLKMECLRPKNDLLTLRDPGNSIDGIYVISEEPKEFVRQLLLAAGLKYHLDPGK